MELENADFDNMFIYSYSQSKRKNNKEFDDFVRFKTKQQLVVESSIAHQISSEVEINSYFSGTECECTNLTNKEKGDIIFNFCVQ